MRLEVRDEWSQIAVSARRGAVLVARRPRSSCAKGQTTRVEPANPARFFLDREIAAMDLDRWSDGARQGAGRRDVGGARDRALRRLADLDAAGEWIQTDDLGAVWKPKVAAGWTPFQNGRWRWYEALGYTWVSDDAWGWLPYHYGRWARPAKSGLGVGAGRQHDLQTRRRVLAARREVRRLGTAGAGRDLESGGSGSRHPAAVSEGGHTYADFQRMRR